MRTRITAWILVLALFTTLLCSCSRSTTSITLPVSSVVKSLDPQIAADSDVGSILNNCMEGLVRMDADGNIQPGVAERWSVSDDGTLYKFYLRTTDWFLPEDDELEDVLGKDYQKTFDTSLTAYDFVFAFQRILDPDTDSPSASSLYSLQNARKIAKGKLEPEELGVSALDNHTLLIQLDEPNVDLLSILSQPAFVPCNEDFFTAAAGRYGMEACMLLCNGPYTIKSMDTSSGTVTLTRNESYEGDYTANLDAVSFVLAEENASEEDTTDIVTSLQSDEGLDAALVEELSLGDWTGSFEVSTYDSEIKTLCFNQRSEFSSSKYLRRSIACATDADVLESRGSAAKGVIPSCCLVGKDLPYRSTAGTVSNLNFDLTQAKKYYKKGLKEREEDREELLASGVDEDDVEKEIPTIDTITVLALEEDRTDVQALIQNWQKVYGTALTILVKTCDTQAELDSALYGNSYDIAYTSLHAASPIASTFLQQFYSTSNSNFLGVKDKTLNNHIRAASQAATANELCKNGKLAEERLVSQAYVVPLRQVSNALVVKDAAHGLYVQPSGNLYAAFAAGVEEDA